MTADLSPAGETGSALAAAERLAELITSSWISHAIHAGIELGVFDALAAGPDTVDGLARRLGCAPAALRQLLRACESLGLCLPDDLGRCQATTMGRMLGSKSEGSQQAWARLWCRDLADLWTGLAESIRHGASVRSLRGDTSGFEHLDADAVRADAFNRAMTSNTWWVAEALSRLQAFDGCRHVVDVGGGHGVLVIALLRRHPTMRATIYDLAHAGDGAVRALEAAGVGDRATFLAGDFFDAVPSGMDAYLLKSVLHDWPDAECSKILASCRAAMSERGRLFVIERLASLPLSSTAGDRAWARSDLNMLVAHGTAERSQAEFNVLLENARFRIDAIHPLSMGLAAIEALVT